LDAGFLSENNKLKENFTVSAFSKRFDERLLFIAQYFSTVIVKYADFCSKKIRSKMAVLSVQFNDLYFKKLINFQMNFPRIDSTFIKASIIK